MITGPPGVGKSEFTIWIAGLKGSQELLGITTGGFTSSPLLNTKPKVSKVSPYWFLIGNRDYARVQLYSFIAY